MSIKDVGSDAGRINAHQEPIAVIGIGCRFPGGIHGPETFWQLLCDGIDAIGEIPPDRMDVPAYFDPRPATPGKMMTRWGGFLDRIDMFDANFFGISPREAERMDPQQRLLLESAWEALEDGGQGIDRLAGSRTGVFIGLWINDYEARMFADPDTVDFYMTTGSGRYSASGRLSFVLGLQGPSLTIDTACSSSLVAVHLACQSLRRGECSTALAGGANVILQPHISIAYSQSKMMAPDGRCKFGDARADGYVRSEGAGVVVLKPLSRAMAEGDSIYAIIRGSAVNNDGRSGGYMTTPAREGQEELLRLAYSDAGISPGQVRYVEAHGTGTLAGDPIEIGALGSVLSSDRSPGCFCYIGSVKTNFGHTEGAAGIAGLIKTALVLKHRAIPASLHLQEPNPKIPWDKLSLIIPRALTPWPDDRGMAYAGVSAFGIAGTNAHIVLSEAPHSDYRESVTSPEAPAFLLPISAQKPKALDELARAYKIILASEKSPSIADLCYTAGCRRMHHEYRLAVAARNAEELGGSLDAFLRGDKPADVFAGRAPSGPPRKIVFVFPGQGSQWKGMGLQLAARESAFRETLDRCEEAMRPFVDWSLTEQLGLEPGAPHYRMEDIDVIQPVLLSMEIALDALWRSWGIRPDAVVGHSLGEVAAGYAAGALRLEDAMRIICSRSLLMRRVRGKGAMAVVAIPMEKAQEVLAGFEDHLSLAVSNSPQSTVLSGDPSSLEKVLDRLRAQNVFCRLVKVDVASHSPQMDPLMGELRSRLEGIKARPAAIPIYSTVTGERIDGLDLGAGYWARNLRQPVLFSTAVRKLLQDEYTVFVEVSPHPILLFSVEETAHFSGREIHTIRSLEREKDESIMMLGSLGKLYALGYPVDWSPFYPAGSQVVRLPSYPWQGQHYWWETRAPGKSAAFGSAPGHVQNGAALSLLGLAWPELAGQPGHHIWQNKIDARFRLYLNERYRAEYENEKETVPESVYYDMAYEAATAVFGEKLHRVSEVIIHHPLFLSEGLEVDLQFVLIRGGPDSASFQIFAREGGALGAWRHHVTGTMDVGHVDSGWVYELQWRAKPRQGIVKPARSDENDLWLIFSDRQGLGAALGELLETRGVSCVDISAGDTYQVLGRDRFCVNPAVAEDMTRLFEEITRRKRPARCHMIYLWAVDCPGMEGMTLSSLEKSESLSCGGVLHLIRALLRSERPGPTDLWLVTRGVQPVLSPGASTLAVAQAPLWGLGRVIALEHPEVWGGLIDLPSSNPGDDVTKDAAARLLAEVRNSDGEDQVVLREDKRYVARLMQSGEKTNKRQPLVLRSDACYLITGGLGGVGLQVARWLVTKGAKHLVLTSRTGLPDRAQWAALPPAGGPGKKIAAIQALEELGAKITVAKTDVADLPQMSALWAELGRTHPPIRGIIHAAGTTRASALEDLEWNELRDVLRPKVSGAWLLHHLTQTTETSLDFLVLFSSGASLWGSQGFGHYAAGNHFMDILAHHRASLGLPGLSINWGWWGSEGMVSGDLAGFFTKSGLRMMPPEQALASLEYLIETGAIQKTIADFDWPVFKPIYEAKRVRPLLEGMTIAPPPKSEEIKEETSAQLARFLQDAPPQERKDLLFTYVQNEVAKILGFASPDLLDPSQGFFKMGMDSLMTVKLRNRLETALGITLPPTIAFEYPTIDALTRFLAAAGMPAEESTGIQTTRAQPGEKDLAPINRHEDLSEEELADFLEKKLDRSSGLSRNGPDARKDEKDST